MARDDKDLDQLWNTVEKRAPASQWQVVSVTFPSTADTDLDIRHSLTPPTQEDIDYQVIKSNGPPLIYHDTSATRIAWQNGVVRLRSSVANLKADLLLTVNALGTRTKIDGATVTLVAVPTGTVKMWAAAPPAPTGYLLCDGTSYLRTAQQALFNVIGVTWGAVDGTHFTVPDFRGQVPIGVGTGAGLTARVLATLYGAETVALITANLAAHNHAVTPDPHSHGGVASAINLTSPFTGSTATYIANMVGTTGTTSLSTTNTGSGTAHANLQPSAGIHFIIKN